MARDTESRTRVEDVYLAIKADIREGRLAPDVKLNLSDFCKEYAVSLTVVREAVTRLASERLVQATPQRGYRVAPLCVPDLLDLTRVRIEIESLTIRESVLEGDLSWEANLVAAHHRLAGIPSTDRKVAEFPNPDWIDAHRDFHLALSAACSSELLKRLREELFEASELYRYWVRGVVRGKSRRVDKEHLAIVNAALARNADEAVITGVDHILRTTDQLIAHQEAIGALDCTPEELRGAREKLDHRRSEVLAQL